MKKKILVLIALIIFKVASAQDTLRLTLHNALDSAIKNNREIVLAKLGEERVEAQFSQTRSVFLPKINLSYTAAATTNPLNALGFKLQQESVSPTDFDPRLLNNPSSTQNYMTKVEWNQPLLNLDLLYQRRAADYQREIGRYSTERTKEYVMFEVRKSYAQLQLSHQAVVVLEEALHTISAIFETTKNYFEKGYLKKSDVLAVQVQVSSAKNSLAEAKSNVRNASDYLGLLMGSKTVTIYCVEPIVKVEQVEGMVAKVPDDRADLKALNSALRVQETLINSTRMSRLPKLNAFANYMFNDKTALGFGSNSYLIGGQLSWTLFNGTASRFQIVEQRIEHARIEQQINYQKEQSQLELNKTYRHLEDTQFALSQYEASVRQAEEALRILQNRFRQGMASTDDMLRSHSTLSEQKLLLTEAVFKYNTALAYLQFLTSTSKIKFD